MVPVILQPQQNGPSLLLSILKVDQIKLPFLFSKDQDVMTVGYDFRDDMEVDKSVFGKYTTELLSMRAERIIANHDKSRV